MNDDLLDLAGIGIGPFNLSLAAQLDSVPELRCRFFERRLAFAWHPGMMLPGAELQTSYLKDLVTATNPTSPWSFLAYLVAQKRFYSFLNAEFSAVPRQEFANYLGWVAEGLGSLSFGAALRELGFARDRFVLRFDDHTVEARNVALGIGRSPSVPAWARPLLGPSCFHTSEAVERLARLDARRVVVIGGGQSGAEAALALLNRTPAVESLGWISRRGNFEPLDASPFTNELFTPGYVAEFHAMGEERRQGTLAGHKLAGDGASPSTLLAIYRRLYELRHLDQAGTQVDLLPAREVVQAERHGAEVRLMTRNAFDDGIGFVHADAVVLATGYAFRPPPFLDGLDGRIGLDRRGNLKLGEDFSVAWDGPRQNRIFALNAGKHSHGIAEPQLSLMAWRSAVIVNALLGRARFDLEPPEPIVTWASGERDRDAAAGDRSAL